MKNISFPAALGVLFLTGVSSVFAGGQPMTIEEMQVQMEELQRQMLLLQSQMAAQQKEAKVAASVKSDNARISFHPGPKIESADGEYSMQIGGRLMVDAAAFDDDKVDHSDGTEVRRARLFVKGKLGKDWSYKLENDFAGNKVTIKDAYIAYGGLHSAKITMGHFKHPFSLEDRTSSRFITFLERASLSVFVPGRSIGLGASTHGGNWSLAGGVFGESVKDSGADDEGYSITARASYAPIATRTEALHFGVAGSYSVPGAGSSVRFRSKPEAHQASVYAVDTGSLSDVDDYTLLGLESAWVSGPFSLQGEYVITDVNRGGASSASDPTFDGYYVQASYFFTGESRHYHGKKGAFGRLKPTHAFSPNGGGLGAWEAAARYSSLDLTDGTVAGGEMDNWTFGLNWYPTAYFRLMFNYIVTDTDSNAVTPNDSPNIFALRTQVDF